MKGLGSCFVSLSNGKDAFLLSSELLLSGLLSFAVGESFVLASISGKPFKGPVFARLPDCPASSDAAVLEACSGDSCTEILFRSWFSQTPVDSATAWEQRAFFSPLGFAGDLDDLEGDDKLIKLLSRICLELLHT